MDESKRDDLDRESVIPVIEDQDPRGRQREITPGDPQLEHVLFVLLGVVLTILVFLRGLGLV